MAQVSELSHKRPRKLWWLIGFVLFALFAVLQMPAAWLLQKYAPNTPYVQHVMTVSTGHAVAGADGQALAHVERALAIVDNHLTHPRPGR